MPPQSDPPVLGVARGWRLEGGDLDDPAVGDALRIDIMDRVKANAGYLGGFIALDRTNLVMRTISLWEDDSALTQSAATADLVVGALSGLTTARVVGTTSYDVLYRHFAPASRDVQSAVDIEAMRAHIVMLDGPGATTPRVLTAVTQHLGDADRAAAPGRTAVLLLRGHTHGCVTCVTLWTDDDAAAQQAGTCTGFFADLATSPDLDVTEAGTHPVLVYEHPPGPAACGDVGSVR